MISKLKTECGDQFTAKVEGMLKDLNVSNDFMKEYRMVRADQLAKEGIDLHFYVLSQSSWPISSQDQRGEVTIPPYLSTLQSDFEKYYISKNKGKCLSWNISLGTCLIQAAFTPQ